ncbi:hypothetical protein RchiOBHm_Chr2g0114421 [Rosa chinensis]|uniref:Uncharacterized protein n=1 Tax=Rosa chinensis TaxID=74649 RepID=A0A2P6RQR5_ROSCH|nr:hypothetical protein RchiOBHm_Chr2g0114421 [Rosa chinensis]
MVAVETLRRAAPFSPLAYLGCSDVVWWVGPLPFWGSGGFWSCRFVASTLWWKYFANAAREAETWNFGAMKLSNGQRVRLKINSEIVQT